MKEVPLSKESPTPWSRTQKPPYKILDANGGTVANLTTMDLANADLIVKSVNLVTVATWVM